MDIAKVIEYYKNRIDWNEFVEKSLKFNIAKPVYCPLNYIKEILGIELPQFVLDRLKPKKENFWERKIFDTLISGASLENLKFFSLQVSLSFDF